MGAWGLLSTTIITFTHFSPFPPSSGSSTSLSGKGYSITVNKSISPSSSVSKLIGAHVVGSSGNGVNSPNAGSGNMLVIFNDAASRRKSRSQAVLEELSMLRYKEEAEDPNIQVFCIVFFIILGLDTDRKSVRQTDTEVCMCILIIS